MPLQNRKKPVVIGLIQHKVGPNTAKNCAKVAGMIKRAARLGAKIICLPELFQTPYFPQYENMRKDDFAESLDGFTVSTMRNAAKKLGVILIVPFFQKKNDRYFNSAVVINKKGRLLGEYHKIHIPEDPGFYEKEYFEHGTLGYKVFNVVGVKFAVLICYDQWFPEAARMARLAGAEIIFYPTATGDIIGYKHPNDWHDAWETIQRGHAIANSVYVVGINRVGTEGRMKFFGESFVCDPWGKILKRASKTQEQVIVQKLDLEYNKFLSEGWGFLRNRRPDTYKMIVSDKFVTQSKKLKNVAHYKDMKRALAAGK